MLVLGRKKGESIVIHDNIEVTIVEIRGDKVRIGVTAPTSVPVHRREVYDAIQREKSKAMSIRLDAKITQNEGTQIV